MSMFCDHRRILTVTSMYHRKMKWLNKNPLGLRGVVKTFTTRYESEQQTPCIPRLPRCKDGYRRVVHQINVTDAEATSFFKPPVMLAAEWRSDKRFFWRPLSTGGTSLCEYFHGRKRFCLPFAQVCLYSWSMGTNITIYIVTYRNATQRFGLVYHLTNQLQYLYIACRLNGNHILALPHALRHSSQQASQ